FDPEALRVYWDDYYEINDERLILHTDGNLSEVAKALYNETAKASDDGYVLDYWSEEPVEFKTLNEGEMYIFGYKKDGEFRFVCLSPVIKYQFLLQWDK
ncbi:MAG: hypothetical protein HUJ75_06570, partial [Parasporobacterium sp.]|nr:hypothetical protein [Parasporobacterium sp.]